MKILIICPLWGYSGGREQYLIDVVEELTIRNHKCCVVYAKLTDKPVSTGTSAKVIKYNIPNLTKYETSMDEKDADSLSSILEKEAPEVIFLSDVKNFQILRLLLDYEKLVAMAHHGWLFCLRNSKTLYFSRKICSRKLGPGCFLHGCFLGKNHSSTNTMLNYNSLTKLQQVASIYSAIETNIVASKYMKSLFLQHGFSQEQIKIIPYYTELPPSYNDAIINEDSNVLFLGRIERYKGVDFLLRSLCKIQVPFTCNIIGGGAYLSYCKKLAKKLRLENSVRFLGWLPREETIPYLQAATVVVVPSIWPEPFGLVGIESMAHGTPVVGFNSGGISDWLQDGNTGYLVSPKDIGGLTNKIEYLLSNPEHARELGAAGRQLVQNKFNKEAHFDQLIRIFEETSKKSIKTKH